MEKEAVNWQLLKRIEKKFLNNVDPGGFVSSFSLGSEFCKEIRSVQELDPLVKQLKEQRWEVVFSLCKGELQVNCSLLIE